MNHHSSQSPHFASDASPLRHLLIYPLEGVEFQKTFEEFAAEVSDWPGMYFEMDGSFVWVPQTAAHPTSIPSLTSPSPGPIRQQIDGMVYDRGGRIEYLDLKGTALAESWQQLLKSLCSLNQIRIYDVQSQSYRAVEEILT